MQNNEFTFWIDPDLTAEPDLTMGLSLSADFGLDSNIFSSLEFLTADNQFDRFEFDEFRIGTTYDSVVSNSNVPEPSSAAIVLLGLTGVSLGSRKRRRVAV